MIELTRRNFELTAHYKMDKTLKFIQLIKMNFAFIQKKLESELQQIEERHKAKKCKFAESSEQFYQDLGKVGELNSTFNFLFKSCSYIYPYFLTSKFLLVGFKSKLRREHGCDTVEIFCGRQLCIRRSSYSSLLSHH